MTTYQKRRTRVKCPYCDRDAELITGDKLYPRRADLYTKKFYYCPHDDAYVGCHVGTSAPLGRLANAELRAEKVKTHALFDPIWKSTMMSRTDAYKWLAEQMGLSVANCHIGMFDVDQCKKAQLIILESRYGDTGES